jgi:predicted dehydrogenase
VVPYSDPEAVLADPDVSAVVVATPVGSHSLLVEEALRQGKSVLCEKPLAITALDALSLVELARQRGLTLMVGHTFLYSPAVQLVADIVCSGELGELLYAQSSRVNLGIHRSDVSVIWDLGPHDLSILLNWVGEVPTRVSAFGRSSIRNSPTDVAFIDLSFPSGFVANLHLSWLAPRKVRRTTLVGRDKMLIYEDTNTEEPVKIYDMGLAVPDPTNFGENRLIYRTGDIRSPRVEMWEPLRAELADFLDRVTRGDIPGAAEETAVDVVRTLEAAEVSLQAGVAVDVDQRA